MGIINDFLIKKIHKDPSLYFQEYRHAFSDFIGITLHVNGIIHFLIILLFTLYLFCLFYFLGKKVLNKFQGKYHYETFISIGIGFIVFGTSIVLFGMFSVLHPFVILLYLLIVSIYALRWEEIIKVANKFSVALLKVKQFPKKISRVDLMVGLLVFITFLRLIPPDINADMYHTDFPRFYLRNHSMMVPPRGNEVFSTVPQLGEMLYVVMGAFGLLDGSRFIHFGFYVLIVFLLYSIANNYKKSEFKLVPLLFVTSSLVLHIAASAYGDFQMLFCFLLSFVTLTQDKNVSYKMLILSGVFFGGVLATKIWTLLLLPVPMMYIFLGEKEKVASIRKIIVFLFSAMIISSVWYIRSFLLTSDPFYNNENFQDLSQTRRAGEFKKFFLTNTGLNWDFITNYGVLPLVGVVSLIIFMKRFLNYFKHKEITYFSLILLVIYLFLSAFFGGRYLLPFFIIWIFPFSIGIYYLFKYRYLKFIIHSIAAIFIIFFLFNTLPLIAYGFGWSNTEKYLGRVPLPYYDYEKRFSKHIEQNETIATYGISGYYFANFYYKNVFYFFTKNERKISFITKNNISKLLLKGGNIQWFCKELNITDCDEFKIILLAKHESSGQYVYRIVQK